MSPDDALLPVPLFSLEERNRRFGLVRSKMREASLSALIFPHATGEWDNFQPGTRYLTCVGGAGMATALIFPLEGDPIVAVRDARRTERAKTSQNWVSDVRAPPNNDWAVFFAQGLRDLGLASENIGVVGLDGVIREQSGLIVYKEFVDLQAALPAARFVSATSIVDAARKRKSAEEITMVERATVCADAIADAFRRVPQPGLWLHELTAEFVAAAIRVGCEMPSMMLLGCAPTMVQTHLDVEFRQIRDDDILLLEAEPKLFGYASQTIQTVSMRPLSTEEDEILKASSTCFSVLFEALKPGASYRDLIDLWNRTAKREGWSAGRSMGHGLGLGQDLPWTTRAGLAFRHDMAVEEGDCFVLKPWVTNAAETVSGRVGAPLVVEAGGARRLNSVDNSPLHVQRG
jgi:Xaa-Pro aminopeptidase